MFGYKLGPARMAEIQLQLRQRAEGQGS
jgi:hypothetical protein